MATEITAMIHELRIRKETLEPQLVLRALQGQVVFLRQALQLVEGAEAQIRGCKYRIKKFRFLFSFFSSYSFFFSSFLSLHFIFCFFFSIFMWLTRI